MNPVSTERYADFDFRSIMHQAKGMPCNECYFISYIKTLIIMRVKFLELRKSYYNRYILPGRFELQCKSQLIHSWYSRLWLKIGVIMNLYCIFDVNKQVVITYISTVSTREAWSTVVNADVSYLMHWIYVFHWSIFKISLKLKMEVGKGGTTTDFFHLFMLLHLVLYGCLAAAASFLFI